MRLCASWCVVLSFITYYMWNGSLDSYRSECIQDNPIYEALKAPVYQLIIEIYKSVAYKRHSSYCSIKECSVGLFLPQQFTVTYFSK